jgi:carbonic anhydrase
MHHLDCAMRSLRSDELAAAVQRDTGRRPPWEITTCSDPVLGLKAAVRRLEDDPYLLHTELVRGFLYDEREGTLTEVPGSDSHLWSLAARGRVDVASQSRRAST